MFKLLAILICPGIAFGMSFSNYYIGAGINSHLPKDAPVYDEKQQRPGFQFLAGYSVSELISHEISFKKLGSVNFFDEHKEKPAYDLAYNIVYSIPLVSSNSVSAFLTGGLNYIKDKIEITGNSSVGIPSVKLNDYITAFNYGCGIEITEKPVTIRFSVNKVAPMAHQFPGNERLDTLNIDVIYNLA